MGFCLRICERVHALYVYVCVFHTCGRVGFPHEWLCLRVYALGSHLRVCAFDDVAFDGLCGVCDATHDVPCVPNSVPLSAPGTPVPQAGSWDIPSEFYVLFDAYNPGTVVQFVDG